MSAIGIAFEDGVLVYNLRFLLHNRHLSQFPFWIRVLLQASWQWVALYLVFAEFPLLALAYFLLLL
jgi:hypothetical protein